LFAQLWSELLKTRCLNTVGHYGGDGNKFTVTLQTLDGHVATLHKTTRRPCKCRSSTLKSFPHSIFIQTPLQNCIINDELFAKLTISETLNVPYNQIDNLENNCALR